MSIKITALYERLSRDDEMQGENFPDTYRLTGEDEVSKTYSFPKSYISYRKPRAVSTEQRERARQMMIERNRAKEN